MDRLGQAEAILSRFGMDGGLVAVAGRAISPMDCQRTLPVARETIAACQAAALAAESTRSPTHPDGARVMGASATAGAVVDAEMLRAASGVPSSAAHGDHRSA